MPGRQSFKDINCDAGIVENDGYYCFTADDFNNEEKDDEQMKQCLAYRSYNLVIDMQCELHVIIA